MSATHTWEAEVARKLGIGGVISFTTTRVGQILEIPCSKGPDGHGHIVNVKIRPNLDPNGTVKQMIGANWIVGRRRLICPDCRGPKKRNAFSEFGAKGGFTAAANMTQEERSARGRKGAEARWAKRKKEGNGQMPEPLLEALEPEQPKPASPTPAAGKAKRLVYLALEDYYDEPGKRYKADWTDAKVAKECGLAESVVKQIREESFGPLGEPQELRSIKMELQAAMGIVARTAQLVVETENKVKAIERKLNIVCEKHGWPVI